MASGVSNVALVEHVNLNVTGAALQPARHLLCTALGLFEDPRPALRGRVASLLWANCGLQQLHLPVDAHDAPLHGPTQVLDGCFHFIIPPHSAEAFLAQLRRAGLSRATLLDAPQLGCHIPPTDGLGNEFVLEEGAEPGDATPTSGAAVFVGGLPTATGQPGFRAEDRRHLDVTFREGEAWRSAPPEPLRPLGLRSIDIVVPPLLLPAVVAFWERTMCARIAPESDHAGFCVLVDGACSRANPNSTDALFGAQWLRFIGGTRRAYDGHHIALYVRDFVGTFERALAAQVVFDNARYSDRGGTLELALENRQFRTLCMHPATTVPPGACSSDRCFQLELEVRSFDHPACPL